MSLLAPASGSALEPALDYARRNAARFVRELAQLVRIPSVSAEPRHRKDVRACASWLARHLGAIGLEGVRLLPTEGHPIVTGGWRRLPGKPTLLLYGHYDVQPVDPRSEWRGDPFSGRILGKDLQGRGASDDKGQLLAQLKAVEALLRTRGRLPLNLLVLLEGEEEIGSPHLHRFLKDQGSRLGADLALISDTRILSPDRPAITYGVRGELSVELEVQSARHDLHSGNYGGALHNPIQALSEILAGLHHPDGRVRVPGFYDRVRRVPESEREYLSRTGPSDAEILRTAQARRSWGERGYSLQERITIRPDLTLTGITGGYQGRGAKAVLPARARAKISLRLVPDQDPVWIERLLREQLARLTPPTVHSSVRTLIRVRPAGIAPGHPALGAAAEAYRRGFGRSPVFLRSGGAVPVVSFFESYLGIPSVLMGFGLPDDRIHAPNEKFHLPNFHRGIRTVLHFLELAGRLGPGLRRPRPGAFRAGTPEPRRIFS